MERIKPQKNFSPHGELTRYITMPKHFVGPEAADDLFSIYETLREEKPYPYYLYVAGSAAAESGLTATHLSPEERHYRIQCADEAWQQSQELWIEKHMDDNWTATKLFTFPDRVQTHRIYNNLLHDMVNGNVRPETIDTTHERLVRLAVNNLRLYQQGWDNKDPGAISYRRGLAYELSTAASITRLRCPSFFAMPAVARSDDGTYHRKDTHDIQLIQQSWGTIRSSLPIEVKPSGNYSLSRYNCAVVRGKVHLKLPSAESPLQLSRFLYREFRGEASDAEIAELNEVTSRILTQVQKHQTMQDVGSSAVRSVINVLT